MDVDSNEHFTENSNYVPVGLVFRRTLETEKYWSRRVKHFARWFEFYSQLRVGHGHTVESGQSGSLVYFVYLPRYSRARDLSFTRVIRPETRRCLRKRTKCRVCSKSSIPPSLFLFQSRI